MTEETPIGRVAKKFAHMSRRELARDIASLAALTAAIAIFLLIMLDAEGRRPSEILLDIFF